MKESVELKKRVTKEIIQTIGVPIVSWVCFFIWLYSFINGGDTKVFIFPLSGIIVIVLYFFAGFFYSASMLGVLTIIGSLSVFLVSSNLWRLLLFFELVWLWLLFFMLEKYNKSYIENKNIIREEEDIITTKMAFLTNKLDANVKHCNNLKQQISNYQLLGGMVQLLGSTLNEEKILPLVRDLAKKFIGKGNWSIKKGIQGDSISKYIKNNNVPLIINSIRDDNRFYIKNAKFASLIAVPLDVNSKFWGILRADSPQENTFAESDLRTLSILGGITSIALNNVKLYEQTQELAITDGLTGLFVQSYFKERLKEEVLRSKSHNLALSIAIFDVDFFKKFNDTYGHDAGDAVLRQLANILRGCFRETDLICRYGGEEFAVLMLQTELNEAQRIVDTIRHDISKERFYLPVESFQPIQVQVTVSVGMTSMSGEIADKDALLAAADSALYKAKRSGRNRVEIV